MTKTPMPTETAQEKTRNHPSPLASLNIKFPTKLKRDIINEKKQQKQREKEAREINLRSRTTKINKDKSYYTKSANTQQSEIKKDTVSTNSNDKNTLSLTQMINKPPYMTLTNNQIIGDLGHATAIFKRPIIEGIFFLEFTIKPQTEQEIKFKYKSAVRVGIVHPAYNPAIPLGCDESVAYKSLDGGLVVQGTKIDQNEPSGAGDVLGVCLNISAPKKHAKPKDINKGSTVSFYKNGKLMLQYAQLKQIFYCFAVSLFNYAQVEVNMDSQSIYAMPEGARHYFASLNEPILYPDLRDQRIFKK